MSIEEVARAIQYLRMVGLTEAQICDFLIYIATGFGMHSGGGIDQESRKKL